MAREVSDLPDLHPHLYQGVRRDPATPRDSLIVSLLPVFVFAAILGGWEAWVRIAEVKRYLLPPPSAATSLLLRGASRPPIPAPRSPLPRR